MIKRAARIYLDAGFSVLPIVGDGSKRPKSAWRNLQHAPDPSIPDTISDTDAIGIVCGKVSGGLEVLDFDTVSARPQWVRIIQAEYPQAAEWLARLPVIDTPSGGAHVYYRCAAIDGNRKLARDGESVVIETRGEGGYVVAPPSEGYAIVGERITRTPVIPAEIRRQLFGAASQLNAEQSRQSHSDTRPGDEWNDRATWEQILEPHGWTRKGTRDGAQQWQRPGKDGPGISATVGACKDSAGRPALYVWSTSTAFEAQKVYDKFSAHACLNHGGDFRAAARELGSSGFGSPAKPQNQPRQPDPPPMQAEATEKDEPTKSKIKLGWASDWGDLYSDVPPPQRYLIATRPSFRQGAEAVGVIPAGRVGMLAAEGGAGKSWAMVQLAVAVASGGYWLETYEACAQGNVALVQAEEETQEVQRRLHHALHVSETRTAEAMQRICPVPMMGQAAAICQSDRNGNIEDTDFYREFMAAMRAHAEWSLIILDPLARFGGQGVETDAAIATKFVALCEALCGLPGNPTVLVAHHTNKASRNGVTTTASASRGHSALTDACRWVATLEEKTRIEHMPDFVIMRVVKSNLATRPAPVWLKRLPERCGALIAASSDERANYIEAAKEVTS